MGTATKPNQIGKMEAATKTSTTTLKKNKRVHIAVGVIMNPALANVRIANATHVL